VCYKFDVESDFLTVSINFLIFKIFCEIVVCKFSEHLKFKSLFSVIRFCVGRIRQCFLCKIGKRKEERPEINW